MQDNIKELEQVTEGLQAELQNKEEIFEQLKKENKELEKKLEAKTQEEQMNSQQATRRLEDEINFLKKHHDLEINLLKEQYERSLQTAKLIAQETAKINNTSQQQSAQNVQSPFFEQSSGGNFYPSSSPMRPQRDHSPQHAGINVTRVKENMANIQNTFDKFRADLKEKESIIEQKDKEILRLRLQFNKEAPSAHPSMQHNFNKVESE